MSEFFINRHYPPRVVQSALARVSHIPRHDVLTPKQSTEVDDRPILSLLYHPSTRHVRNILISNWSILQSRQQVANIFNQPPLITYKRDTNIRDLLVRSRLKLPTNKSPGTFPCQKPKCKVCPFICSSTRVYGHRSSFSVTKYFSCQTENLVYVLHCLKCSKLYIGETGRSLATRFKEHLADIVHHRDKPVAHHFNQPDHSTSDVRVKGLWLMFTRNTSDRKDMESHLIDKLGSRKPFGLNDKP